MAGSVQCPQCGRQYPAGAVLCANCGIDLRTGEAIPESMLRQPSAGLPIAPILKSLVYLAILAVVLYFGWKIHKSRQTKEAQPAVAAAPAAPTVAQPAPAAHPPAGPAKAGELQPRQKLPLVLAQLAAPFTWQQGVNELAVLLRADYSLAQEAVQSKSPMIRAGLAEALAIVASEQAAADLLRLSADASGLVSRAASDATGRVQRAVMQPAAVEALASPNPQVQLGALRILARQRYREKPEAVKPLLEASDARVQAEAAEYFQQVVCPDWALEGMLALAASTDEPLVANRLASALKATVSAANVKTIEGPLKKIRLNNLFIVAAAAVRIGGSDAHKALAERLSRVLKGLPEERRAALAQLAASGSDQSRRQMLLDLLLAGELDKQPLLPIVGVFAGSQAARALSIQSFWLAESADAVPALASQLFERDPYLPVCAVLALARQERSAVSRYMQKVKETGGDQERLLADVTMYLAGDNTLASRLLEAASAGGVSPTAQALALAAVAAEKRQQALPGLRRLYDANPAARDPLTAMLAAAGIHLAGGAEGWQRLMSDIKAAGRRKMLALGWYIAFLALERSEQADYSLLLDVFEEQDMLAALVVGKALARVRPAGLPEKFALRLGRVHPMLRAPAALFISAYGDEGRQMLIGKLRSTDQQVQLNAIEILGAAAGGSTDALVSLLELMRDTQDAQLTGQVLRVLKSAVGKDYGAYWQQWYKALALEKYDFAQEPLDAKSLEMVATVNMPTLWKTVGGSYECPELPGNPRVRASLFRERVPRAQRRYQNAEALALAIQQRFQADVITRTRRTGVKVSASDSFGVFGVRFLTFTVEDANEKRTFVFSCGVWEAMGEGVCLEVEASCETGQFERYKQLFDNIVRSVIPTRRG